MVILNRAGVHCNSQVHCQWRLGAVEFQGMQASLLQGTLPVLTDTVKRCDTV